MISNSITSIKATVEGILDGIIAPEEISDYLGTIDRQTDRLNNLVEELSYLSLNQVNKVETEQETIFRSITNRNYVRVSIDSGT